MPPSSVERRHVFRSACRRKWKHLTAVLSSQHLACSQALLHPLGTPCSPQIQREMTEGRRPHTHTQNPPKDSSLNKIDSPETASALLIVWSQAADSMLLAQEVSLLHPLSRLLICSPALKGHFDSPGVIWWRDLFLGCLPDKTSYLILRQGRCPDTVIIEACDIVPPPFIIKVTKGLELINSPICRQCSSPDGPRLVCDDSVLGGGG